MAVLKLLLLVALVSGQQQDATAMRRDAAELKVAARTFDPKAFAAAAAAVKVAEARMTRCDRLVTQHAGLVAASQARWKEIAARTPLPLQSAAMLADFMTEETMTPAGARQAALWREYRACMTEGAPALPESARTCARLEQPIADLTLLREQRWIAFRGSMPTILRDRAESKAYHADRTAKRIAFMQADGTHPDQLRLAGLTAERHRACARGVVPAAIEPDW